MNLLLRKGCTEDVRACGSICFHAFKAISEQHNFPCDFPSVESTYDLFSSLLGRQNVYSVVAEIDGQIIGSNFLWENQSIAGIGPITVDPAVQNSKIGQRLMEDVLERSHQKAFPGVRLLQAGYHNRSLSLYTKLGFDVREPLVNLQGSALKIEIPGHSVRLASENDFENCNKLCLKIHGHDRRGELLDAIQQGTASVVECDGRITGYTTMIGFFGHTVGENNEDIKALIGAATEFTGPGFLLPSRNSELFRWCLSKGLRVVQTMTLMSMGLYNEPAGAFLPSIVY